MTKNEHFEKLHLNTGVNPIMPERCPEAFPLHWHQYVEIMALPYDASITENPVISINNTEYVLTPGDIVFAWSGELHEILNNHNKQLIALQFPGSIISEMPEFVPYLNPFRSIHMVNGQTQPELAKSMHSHLIHMLELKQSMLPFTGVELLICLYELFITFGTYIQEQHNIFMATNADCPRQSLNKMTQACTYISENCEQTITLEDIAEQFGFSIYYFSRIFKTATSYNFTEYLTLQRVKRAQLYLAESDLNITEIAFLSGFKSISSFNRAFRSFRGCSPRDYRKYHSNE